MGRIKPGDVIRKFEEKKYLMEQQFAPLKPGEVSFRATMLDFFRILDGVFKEKFDKLLIIGLTDKVKLERPELNRETITSKSISKEDLFKIIDQRQQRFHTLIELIGNPGITKIPRK